MMEQQHAVGYVTGDQYYGAKASINVWAPEVTNQDEFSLSQIWVISGSFDDDLNTIEAGWQVYTQPCLYVFISVHHGRGGVGDQNFGLAF